MWMTFCKTSSWWSVRTRPGGLAAGAVRLAGCLSPTQNYETQNHKDSRQGETRPPRRNPPACLLLSCLDDSVFHDSVIGSTFRVAIVLLYDPAAARNLFIKDA